MTDWGQAHNQAYVNYISKELGLKIEWSGSGDDATDLYRLLASEQGQAALKAYAKRVTSQSRVQKVAGGHN